MIIEKSHSNQFIVTTHSNIVTKYLGALTTTKIFELAIGLEKNLPISIFEKVDNSPESRRKVLENLGYELGDEDLWDAWLFLEESSAETIIRSYFILWFAPGLVNRLRTFSCKGVDNITPKFEDFNTLFCFLNMQPTYKNRVWVIIDAGQKEDQIIQDLKNKYTPNGWHEDRFLQFTKHDFEEYYPAWFDAKRKEILAMPVSMDKRERKLDLLKEVEAWIAGNEQEAKKEFEISAKEVIDALKEIQNQLHPEPSHQ